MEERSSNHAGSQNSGPIRKQNSHQGVAPASSELPTQNAVAAETVRNIRGKFEFWHDCYKSTVATMKKNVSFRKRQLLIEEFEHRHNFHSVDRMGNPQKHCVPVGGHYHEVTVIMDPGQPPRTVCGPPLRKIKKTDQYGFDRTIVEEVTFLDWGSQKTIKDDHRHDFEYLHSEKLVADHRPLPKKGPELDPRFTGEVKGL